MKKPIQIIGMSLLCLAVSTTALASGKFTSTTKDATSLNYQISGIDDIGKTGLFFHLGGFTPSGNHYNVPKKMLNSDGDLVKGENASKSKFGFGYELEVGHMFRLAEIDAANMAIGIRTTWFGFGYSAFKDLDKDDFTMSGYDMRFNLVKFGPYVSYELTDQMAVDVFYQFSPRYSVTHLKWKTTNTSDKTTSGSFGANHDIGVGFRLDMLSLGFAYRTGAVTNIEAKKAFNDADADLGLTEDFYKYKTNNFRFFVGFKI